MCWKALHSYGVGKRCTVMVLERAAPLWSLKGFRNPVHNQGVRNCQTTMVSESAATYLEIKFQDTNELDAIYCNIIIHYILMNISTLPDISCSILIYSDSTLTTDFICLPERFLQVMVNLYCHPALASLFQNLIFLTNNAVCRARAILLLQCAAPSFVRVC